MKLIECYIENFGRISKQKYSFKDGLNCIKGDNGSGKTTLAAFIKVMLYGMSDTKKTSLDENDRKRYLPWQGGACGGTLTFSAGGRTYRVERSFASKATDDTYTLYDTATGRVCHDFPDGLGEGLFGIDADGFERTVFLSERALTPKSDNKSISAKLSDLVGCDGDIGGMDEAMKALEEQRKFYHKRGGSGELADVKSRIDELTRRLEALSETERALEAAHGKMKSATARIEEARGEAKLILKEREAATIRAAEVNYDKQLSEMKASLEESIRRRTAVGEIFGADIPSFLDIDEASYKSNEAKNLEMSVTDSPQIREFAALSAKFDGRVERSQIEEARTALSAIKTLKEKQEDPRLTKAKRVFAKSTPTESEIGEIEELLSGKKSRISAGYIIACITSALVAVIGFVFMPILAIVGVVGVILSLILGKSAASRAKKKIIDDFFSSVSGVGVSSEDEIRARLKDMRELLPVIETLNAKDEADRLNRVISDLILLFPDGDNGVAAEAAERIIKEYDRYAELAVAERYMKNDRTARAARAAKLRSEADSFVKRFKTTSSDPFTELRTALTEYNSLTAQIVAKRDEMAQLQSQNSMGEGSQRKARADLELLDKKRQENEELVANLSREYALAERAYNSYIDELDGRDELYMRRAELEETLAKYKDNYETILLTKKYITAAKDNITARYLGKTKAGFLKYAEIIGGISGESFEMDTDFGVTKQEGAATRSVEAYSRGTRDLFNLASRLALVDSLYEKESPFIILDDPFTAFDDGKTAAALKLLKELSKDRQIVYFTCAKSRGV